MNNHSTPLNNILFVNDCAKFLQSLHKTMPARNVDIVAQNIGMVWFQQASGPTLPTTTQPGETAASPSLSRSAAVSAYCLPTLLASKHSHMIYAAHRTYTVT